MHEIYLRINCTRPLVYEITVCVCVKSISAFDLSGQRRPRFLIVIGGVCCVTHRQRENWLVRKRGGEFFQEVEDCGGRDISVVCIVETKEFEPSNPVRCGRKIRVLLSAESSLFTSRLLVPSGSVVLV